MKLNTKILNILLLANTNQTLQIEKYSSVMGFFPHISISTGANDRSSYPIFNKKSGNLEALLTICRPKTVLSAGSLCGSLVPSFQSKYIKRTFMLPKSIIFQSQICYKSQWNISCKTISIIHFRGQTGSEPLQRSGVKGFILPHKCHVPNFYQSFWYTLAN